MSDAQNAHDQTDPGLGAPDDLATRALKIMPTPPVPAADATQRMDLLPPTAPAAEATQRMDLMPPAVPAAEATQRMDFAPGPAFAATQSMELAPPLPEARSQQDAPPRSNLKYWVIGILAVVLLAGTLGYYFMYPSGEAPVTLVKAEVEVPPVLRPYLDRAAQGDASAMQMLGTCYYNGLYVKRDQREGLKWYRKAAAAGSVAAKRDLEQLGQAAEAR